MRRVDLQRKFLIALGLFAALIAIGAVGYHSIVGGTWLQATYMTVITLSSVGFGEIIPGLETSTWGRLFTMVLIFAGVAMMTFVLSTSTRSWSKAS